MNIASGIISWVCLYLVGVFFILAASTYALFGVINAGNVAETLRSENTYSKIVPAVLSGAPENTGNLNQLPLQAPWVRSAAETAFPASDLEQKSQVVINSTFAWLEGKTAEPEFTIDFTQNKQRFGEELGSNLEEQLNGLPVCSRSNMPSSFNVYTATCLPPGVNPAQAKRLVSQQVAADTSFLRNPVITSGNLSGANAPAGTGTAAVVPANPLAGLESLKLLFENKSLLLWLLPAATVLAAVLGFILAPSREKALRRLTRSFVMSAVSLVIIGFLLGYGLERLTAVAATGPLGGDIFNPVLFSLAGQMRTYYFICAGLALLLAVVLFAGRRYMKRTI